MYHKSSAINGQSILESPIPDDDLPLVGMPSTGTQRHVHWWTCLWQHTQHGTGMCLSSNLTIHILNLYIVEAFPPDWNPSSSHQPMVYHKPPLPARALHTQRRASQHSDAGSANGTIVADPRVQELEEMVLALQQEIEETRQDRSGAQNGALMREMVGNHNDATGEHGQQENGNHGSVTMMSTTVV